MLSIDTFARTAMTLAGVIFVTYLGNLLVVAGYIPVSAELALDGPQQFVLLLIMSGLFTATLMLRYAPSAAAGHGSS